MALAAVTPYIGPTKTSKGIKGIEMPYRRALKPVSPMDMQEGFARLSRRQSFQGISLDTILSELAESVATLTGIERASVWAFNDRRDELRCWERYELSSRRHGGGEVLTREHFPAYFEALAREEAIVADNAYSHPETQEFVADYLPRHRVTAMLDTPIHIRGELQGVLRLEQVGLRQPWTTVHRLLAHAIANLVTLALVEHEAADSRRHTQQLSDRLLAVFDAAREAMLLVDCHSGLILDANRRAEVLFGYHRVALVGKPQQQVLPPQEGRDGYFDCVRCAADGCEDCPPQSAQILCSDSRRLAVELTTAVADLAGERRWALATFRLPG